MDKQLEYYYMYGFYRRADKLMKHHGFTIVELLIVIVVIAILAAITVVSYNGIQARANTSKINSDLATLQKAIYAARTASGDTALRYITSTTATAGMCVPLASGADLSDKVAYSGCWTRYNNTLNLISNASGVNVRSLVDPWGRPYFIDENDQEYAHCSRDQLGTYRRPHVQANWQADNAVLVPTVSGTC